MWGALPGAETPYLPRQVFGKYGSDDRFARSVRTLATPLNEMRLKSAVAMQRSNSLAAGGNAHLEMSRPTATIEPFQFQFNGFWGASWRPAIHINVCWPIATRDRL